MKGDTQVEDRARLLFDTGSRFCPRRGGEVCLAGRPATPAPARRELVFRDALTRGTEVRFKQDSVENRAPDLRFSTFRQRQAPHALRAVPHRRARGGPMGAGRGRGEAQSDREIFRKAPRRYAERTGKRDREAV